MRDPQWQPASFMERGAAVPFTTPALAGTRARQGTAGLEFIVQHPGGARGVYILARHELPNFCAATLHDTLLAERLAEAPAITPPAVRAAARFVALRGAAGRPAAAAARTAARADRDATLTLQIRLLQHLIHQTGGPSAAATTFDQQAKDAIRRTAASAGTTPAAVATDIEAIAGLCVGHRVAPQGHQSPCARLVRQVTDLAAALRDRAESTSERTALAATLASKRAEITAVLAGGAMACVQAQLADLPTLLAVPAGLAACEETFSRPAWALDGWDQMCGIWAAEAPLRWRAALSEMIHMVPSLPRQAADWIGRPIEEADHQGLRKLLQHQEEWRSAGIVIDLIARNEQIRTQAA